MTPPTPAHPPAHPATLAQECGLSWPKPSLASWPPDRHFAVALALALPVWLALGLWAGPHMRVPAGWWAWASLVLMRPAMEELVFRGILQGLALRLTTSGGQPRRLGTVTLANVLVTAGFVAVHLIAQPFGWAFAVAAPSLALGHLRERFGSVWPPLALHAVYNAGFGLTAWLVH
jgi:membrane protease YdiL (CAAX protease family)